MQITTALLMELRALMAALTTQLIGTKAGPVWTFPPLISGRQVQTFGGQHLSALHPGDYECVKRRKFIRKSSVFVRKKALY